MNRVEDDYASVDMIVTKDGVHMYNCIWSQMTTKLNIKCISERTIKNSRA